MSKFAINFIVDARYLGDVMAALQPYKVEDLGFKLVANTKKNSPPAGGATAWQTAAAIATATPQPLSFFKTNLISKGFKLGTVYNALDTAVENKVLFKKMIGGNAHYYARESKT